MRKASRKEILEALERVWDRYPDWRLGQLVVNVGDSRDPYYLEDDDLLRELREWLLVHTNTARIREGQ